MEARLLTFLSHGAAKLAVLVDDGKVLVDRGEGRCIAARAEVLKAVHRTLHEPVVI